METKTEIRTVKEIVYELLRDDIRCRNDDKWLTYRVMSHFTRIYIPFEDFIKIPSFETISRCRRYVQHNDNDFLPTLESRKKRSDREMVFAETMKYD